MFKIFLKLKTLNFLKLYEWFETGKIKSKENRIIEFYDQINLFSLRLYKLTCCNVELYIFDCPTKGNKDERCLFT